MQLSFQSSVFFVKDIEVSKKFYGDILGQEIALDLGANVGFKCGIAIWQIDKAYEIIYNKAVSGDSAANKNLELYFESDNIEEIENQLKSLSVKLIHNLKEEPWRQMTIRFYDPDGNIIEVGESMEALVRRLYRENNSIREIAEMTTLPMDYVEGLLL